MTVRNFAISKMYCTKCGNEGICIPRKNNKYKEPGHLKKIYCIHCQKEQNHVEIRPIGGDYTIEDFRLELQYKNFDDEGNRILPYRIFRSNLRKEGKCS